MPLHKLQLTNWVVVTVCAAHDVHNGFEWGMKEHSSAEILRKFPGFEHFDETLHCSQCIKPGTGTKDAPRAFSLKLKSITEKIGMKNLKFNTTKCHKIHVGRANEKCPQLKAGGEIMKSVDHDSYLGDIIEAEGKMTRTIASRKKKGVGIIYQE